MSSIINFACAIITLGLLTSTVMAQSLGRPEMELSFAYHDKYVTEGRDNLGDGGLFTYEFGADFGNGLSGGIWSNHDNSDLIDYKETNVFLEYGFGLHTIDTYLGYTFLHFNDGSRDHEIGAGVATTALPITLAVDVYHSTEANGSFAEISISHDYQIGAGLTLTPSAVYGFDHGYATPAHDGENHIQIGLEAQTQITEHLILFGYLAKAFAGKDIKIEGGDDLTWGGLGFRLNL